MAKNGQIISKFYFTASGGGYFHQSDSLETPFLATIFDWNISSQDVVNGTSTISWTLKFDCTHLATVYPTAAYLKLKSGNNIKVDSYNSATSSVAVTHNSVTGSTSNIAAGDTAMVKSGSFEVAHNSSGAKTLYNFRYHITGIEVYDADGTKKVSSSAGNPAVSNGIDLILDTISTHAVVTSVPESFTDEDSPTMYYGIPNKATKAEVGIAFGDSSTVSIPYRTVSLSSTSYTFNFTASEKNIIWGLLKQGIDTTTARFYIRSTVDGIPYIEYLPSTLSIRDYKPTLNPVVYDTNTDVINRLTGNKYVLVRHESDVYWETGAEAHKGANINTQSVKNGDKTYYGASGTIEDVPDNKFTFTVVDDAGRTEQSVYNVPESNWIKYIKLTCSSEVTEMTGEGKVNVTLKGKYFDGHFGKKANTLRMHYDISKNNEESEMVDWGYIDKDNGTNASTGYPARFTYDAVTHTYTYEFTIPELEYLSVYELTVRVSDELSVEPTETHTVIASTPIFDWSRTDFNFNVPVNINGSLTVSDSIKVGSSTVPTIQAQGTNGIWTYRTWSDGTAECWGKKDVSVTFPTAANWGGLFTTGAIAGSNILFPYGLFAETPIVNASLLIRSAGGILMAPGGAGDKIATWDQTGVYEIARGSYVSGTQAYTINYHVIGRWK